MCCIVRVCGVSKVQTAEEKTPGTKKLGARLCRNGAQVRGHWAPVQQIGALGRVGGWPLLLNEDAPGANDGGGLSSQVRDCPGRRSGVRKSLPSSVLTCFLSRAQLNFLHYALLSTPIWFFSLRLLMSL